jgi:hypothetical protein
MVQFVQIVAAPTCFLPRVAVEDEGGGLNGLNSLNVLNPVRERAHPEGIYSVVFFL